MYKNIILIYLSMISLCLLYSNEYNTINTSRPGMSNSTSSVPKGLYQFEFGTNLLTAPNQDTTLMMPSMIRMGIMNNTELQVAYSSNYLTIGLLYGNIKLINTLQNSIIITSSMTKNDNKLTIYNLYFPASYSLKNGFSIWGHLNSSIKNDNSEPIISYAIALGDVIGKKVNWFFETYQSIDDNATPNPISIDYGFSYSTDVNTQFDISMGITFDKIQSKYKETSRFIEWGFSFRLPK